MRVSLSEPFIRVIRSRGGEKSGHVASIGGILMSQSPYVFGKSIMCSVTPEFKCSFLQGTKLGTCVHRTKHSLSSGPKYDRAVLRNHSPDFLKSNREVVCFLLQYFFP